MFNFDDIFQVTRVRSYFLHTGTFHDQQLLTANINIKLL